MPWLSAIEFNVNKPTGDDRVPMKMDPLAEAWTQHMAATQKLQQIGFELSTLTMKRGLTPRELNSIGLLEEQHEKATRKLTSAFAEGLRLWGARSIEGAE